MKTVRVNPRLEYKEPNLVKITHLEGLRVLAKPYAFAKFYYQPGADGLMFMNVANLVDANKGNGLNLSAQ